MKVLFVTNCDPQKATKLEKEIRDRLLPKIPNLSLSFTHNGALPHQIAEKVKDKKPTHIVLAKEFCSHQPQAIPEVVAATKKRMKERVPIFYQLEIASSHPDVVTVKNEEDLLEHFKKVA